HRAGACGTQILKVLAPSWMAHKDVEKVVSEVLAGLPRSVAEEHIRRGGVRAYQFLEANQALLKVVANTLEQAGTLDGAEFSPLPPNTERSLSPRYLNPTLHIPSDNPSYR